MNFAWRELRNEVLETAADRFERRLTDETGKLRGEMSEIRVDMSRMETRLIRWMFVFWLGQLGVTLTIVGVILRSVKLL